MSVAILGSGLIGMFVGLHLNQNSTVHFVGRSPRFAGIREFTTSVMQKPDTKTTTISYSTNIKEVLQKDVNMIIVSVKRVDLDVAMTTLAAALESLPPKTITIVTLMNGIDSSSQIKKVLPQYKSLEFVEGIWSTNVVATEQDGCMNWNQGSSGVCYLQLTPTSSKVANLLNHSGIKTVLEEDVVSVQHGKLLMNLNNAICALSGLPLWQELMTPQYRALLAQCITEALEVYSRAGIAPKALTPVPFSLLPYILSYTPTVVLKCLGRWIVNVDEKATSSMYEDLFANRSTEIDYLNGYIVQLAALHDVSVPHCNAILQVIKEVEKMKCGIVRYDADEIMANHL
jgi:2-dehydropantoate 2-reductase